MSTPITSASPMRLDAPRERGFGAPAFVPWIVLAVLASLPLWAAATDQYYYLDFARRILIVVLATASLNLLVGYGGMVALGHAGFVGVGAYTVAAFVEAGVQSAWTLWALSGVCAGLVACLMGTVALRTRGVYFIMITLAFAQLLYYLAVSMRIYGGDDGYNLPFRPQVGPGLSLDDSATFFWLVLAFAAACFAGLQYLLGSRFGKALCGIRDNEARMTALGYPVFRLRLAAFTLAGAIAGLSGSLLIMHNGFISPSSIHWSQSSILLVMLVLGGVARPWGAAIGTTVWMVLEEVLRQSTEYWHWPLGALLILIVLAAPQGLAQLHRRGKPATAH
ncbi:branched-chain amino acid transport system permease protein [Variovorax guangxiensis]|uniref:Branched-chain amino acid transport system permease protein n=2 Tax=Variovorax guangxiensis TaxID=1775474 RepID=A0A840FZC3_9BURK|nr:branched-chain amino acid transport system permease protein [Variovorax guangxiensis]